MDKASGVYRYITDNSVQTGGTASFIACVTMLTQKGKIGPNMVTASTFKDVVGYDLSYNSNYYGLSALLENVSYAYVWRLNQNAYLGNIYLTTATGAPTTLVHCTSQDQLEATDNVYMAVGHVSVGDWGTKAVKFTPTLQNATVTNTSPTVDAPLTATVTGVSATEEPYTLNSVDYFGGAFIYGAEGNSIIGLLKTGESGYDIFPVQDGIVGATAYGTATLTAGTLSISLTQALNNDTFWNVKYVSTAYTEWTLSYASYDATTQTYTTIGTTDFSTSSTSDIYYTGVDFGDLFLYLTAGVPSSNTNLRAWSTLLSGTNGDSTLSATNLDMTPLSTMTATAFLMNGYTGLAIVNKIAQACANKRIHTFVDAPAFASYIDTYTWRTSVYASEYVSIGAVPDQIDTSSGQIYVYPSISYGTVFANMLTDTGTLNYPPAGYTYGTVNVTNLLQTDFSSFGNELKTNRINYQISTSSGSCIWEQRTTYSLNSDLSYIAPVFIVDALCDELVDFERNYNFRYMTPTDLLNQESGLTSVLDDYVSNNFLYNYTLNVPSYADAQKSRTLDIYIGIQVEKDSEVINLRITLNS